MDRREAVAESIQRDFRELREIAGQVVAEIAASEGRPLPDYASRQRIGSDALSTAIEETRRVVSDSVQAMEITNSQVRAQITEYRFNQELGTLLQGGAQLPTSAIRETA